MTSKNSQAGPITIIKFLLLLSQIGYAAPKTITPEACNGQFRATLSRNLVDFLKKPTPQEIRNFTIKLCRISPEGPTPCPINIGEERMADFESATEDNASIVPVIACASKVAAGSETEEELKDLQAKLLDKYGEKFFTAWAQIPKEVKGIVQTFDDFARRLSNAKIKDYENRISILERAPTKLKKEVSASLVFLREQVSELKKEKPKAESDSDITFKKSNFFQELKAKLIRMVIDDPVRATTLAIQVMQSEGLDYKGYFKTESRSWNVCSTATDSAEGCKVSTISVEESHDSCGKFGYFDLILQSGPTWIVTTASSSFRINAPEYLTPVAVLLERSDAVMRFWILPDGFSPKYLSSDLHSLYASTVLKTDDGTKLAEIFLLIQDRGRARITEPPKDVKTLVTITNQSTQKLKDLDGSQLELSLPKVCW